MPGVNIQDLVGGHVAGHTLQQPFYGDPDVFSLDRERVLDRLWHLAGHVSRIPAAGDYFLFRICGEEIIIVRGRDGNIHAHYNVCRHRGSRVCLDSEGKKSALVCPYHAWTYNLDGSLRTARLMPEEFSREGYGLHACRIKVLDGVIFVSLADEPVGLDDTSRDCRNYLSFHGIENAKIARRLELPTRANWKLVVENFIECYHCIPAHPEYCSVHSELKLLAAGAGVGSGPEAACQDYAVELNAWKKQVEALGHPCLEGAFDHGAGMIRMPIKEGFLTESQDGRPVSTLMGKFREYDGGVTYVAFNYLNYLLASNDHAVILRFTPISELVTDVEAIWLVDGDAREGVDYVPERVSWVWDATLKQDAVITENNQAGILSSHYQPGPYSEQEVMNREFTRWYLDKLCGRSDCDFGNR
ncbi:MAG: aromatic ring-hydroxylating dioxygenase subunit alpha [Gammaproteobacteria bacterium]|nr:aromatic ring-hydroxylating dioxygenase subunit alpha [Gammaproteobacteria bacterium]MDE0514612.1 aromatic ring-hydroxylating dioxygenase subunit alpha [Gammaproteobacteria bacterium]